MHSLKFKSFYNTQQGNEMKYGQLKVDKMAAIGYES